MRSIPRMIVLIVVSATLYTACGDSGGTGPTAGSGQPAPTDSQTPDRGGDGGGGGDGRSLSTVRFRSLSVAVTPPGGGTVSDNFASRGSAVQDCAACRETYRLGTRVVLTASAAPGFAFARWQASACDGSPSPTCSLVIEADERLTAVFTPVP